MSKDRFSEMHKDCLLASNAQPAVRAKLARSRIAVTGGTGFLGSWIAETVAALNDEYGLGIQLSLYARNTNDWARKYPHLSGRTDIRLHSQDVRSPFEFAPDTNYVIHAAGIPNNRVHSSDPLRVHQTTVLGINNALDAASQLNNLTRFLNVSSCLVSGTPTQPGPLKETDYYAIPCGQLHTVYPEAKRTAENLAAVYRSQFRMSISTVRPFTFTGPYQELESPWAINNFLRDILTGNEIRIHGDGSVRRSYLYGSDAAWWVLAALVLAGDGQIYNVGSPQPVSHLELVRMIGGPTSFKPRVVLITLHSKLARQDDLFPDTTNSERNLGVTQTCSLEQTLDKTYRWFATAPKHE
jgi:dTDP-glucose 4,6-dehydratase